MAECPHRWEKKVKGSQESDNEEVCVMCGITRSTLNVDDMQIEINVPEGK